MAKKKLPPKKNRTREMRNEIMGLPIVDATSRRIIKISKADVKLGRRNIPSDCAAAHALKREPDVVGAHVYRSVAYVVLKDKVERYLTPARLRTETISYDRGGKSFLDGDYMLLPPAPSQKLGAGHRAGRKGSPDKRRAPPTEVRGARPRGHSPSSLTS